MTAPDDKAYHDSCAQLFAEIEALVDSTDADFDNNGNVIEIVTAGDEKIIINKQPPMHEVWLAARSGGRHFRLREGEWRDTRDGTTLMQQLRALLS